MVDRNFLFPRTAVGIVAVGDSGEALLLRAMLESLGASVRLYLPGTPEDILVCLKQPDNPPPYLIISGHGDENGLVVGECDTEITRTELKNGSMHADILSGNIDLRDTVVFSTACCTGSQDFAKVFIEGRAHAYIASHGYPDGAATPLFVHLFFYQLLIRKSSLEDALLSANMLDGDGELAFTLFTASSLR
ncbi:hypothetical protein J8N08_05945 [Agrobacterium tumefaciens]|jgi:hypothetical protein|uniref:hypothetical protein n=1 Tax=Agrobacterium tumefaciens TaxID=358 RepID=UPI0015727E98|nr:hypothetical protein [Agrobacterium tumefaciens]NTC82310.1 hypothetical protein [Agrobacterium tumefaciens]NTD11917.1 hypothetical protein [Agrobacterium tumefaciens]QTQ83679.1 hypothetical protein J8N08_05945 [Agrobacterium tumefaciens]